MKIRLALTAFLVAFLCVALVTLTFSPLIQLAITQTSDPHTLRAFPWVRFLVLHFSLNLGLMSLVLALLFQTLVVGPLKELDRLSSGNLDASVKHWHGPFAAQFGRAFGRLRRALVEESARNQSQLTQLQGANDSLRRLQTELVANDRLATAGKLAAGVAHEVGNPLTGILGYLSVLRPRIASDATAADLIKRIEAELRRIDSTVRSLLELGRPSRGRPHPIDARLAIDSAVRLVSAGDIGATRVEVEAPSQFWVLGEAGPLSQVLINLIMNATQAMEEGTVRVTAKGEGTHGLICVTDEGPGLSQEVMKNLFSPFFTTRPPGQGTGLGLAMSRHLLTELGGELRADNNPTGGAAFTISLPLASPA